MRVAVGGLIHDRWSVQQYMEALCELSAPCEVSYAFVLDDMQDDSEIWDLMPEGAEVVEAYLSGPHYHRHTSRDQAVYGRMARLRNLLRELVLGLGCDYLLAVDSDIVVPPDLLEKLLATGKPWVAPLVRNDAKDRTPRGHWNVFKLTRIEDQAGLTDHFRPMGRGINGDWPGPEGAGWDPRDNTREECLAAGAACLYSRELLETVRWRTDGRGQQEDIGFAMDAFRAGFRAWYLPIRCRHLTVDGLEEA
jgi:hypothetical protein